MFHNLLVQNYRGVYKDKTDSLPPVPTQHFLYHNFQTNLLKRISRFYYVFRKEAFTVKHIKLLPLQKKLRTKFIPILCLWYIIRGLKLKFDDFWSLRGAIIKCTDLGTSKPTWQLGLGRCQILMHNKGCTGSHVLNVDFVTLRLADISIQ